jgi:uncharacterized protein (TIGR02145 family)
MNKPTCTFLLLLACYAHSFAQQVLDGSNVREGRPITNGLVTVSGMYSDGYLRFVDELSVRFTNVIAGAMVEVNYKLKPEIRKETNGSLSGYLFPSKDGKQLEVTRAPHFRTKIAVSGTVVFMPPRKPTVFSELIVPENRDILTGWLLSEDTDLPKVKLQECDFLPKQPVQYSDPASFPNTNKSFAIFKFVDGFKLELVMTDGKTNNAVRTFKTVTIGAQQWMVENLDVSTFRNGDSIPEAKTPEQWSAAYRSESAAWCYYNNDPKYGEKYGRLYNWYVVNDPRGLAPSGWHIPTDKEWQMLIASCGGTSVAFSELKKSDGFAALPAGARWFKDASFNHLENITFWWAADKNDKWNAWYHAMHFGNKQIARDNGGMNTGHSIRCVKDK